MEGEDTRWPGGTENPSWPVLPWPHTHSSPLPVTAISCSLPFWVPTHTTSRSPETCGSTMERGCRGVAPPTAHNTWGDSRDDRHTRIPRTKTHKTHTTYHTQHFTQHTSTPHTTHTTHHHTSHITTHHTPQTSLTTQTLQGEATQSLHAPAGAGTLRPRPQPPLPAPCD